MKRPCSLWPGLLWLAATAFPAQAQTRYRVTFPEAARRYVQVEAHYATAGEAEVELFMPVWTPGDYIIRDFSQWVDRLSAAGKDGQPLHLQALSKSRWRVSCAGQSEIVLAYRVKGAKTPEVASNYVDSAKAVLQGTATFISPVKPVQPAFELQVELPAGWKSIETGLPPAPGPGPGHYLARDFDQLVDCPIVAGSTEVQEFRVAGVRHRLVYLRGFSAIRDGARAVRDVAKVVEATHQLWGVFPFAQEPPRGYWFLNLPGLPGPGLEHKNSTCIEYSAGAGKNGHRKWLNTLCHEYFHTWNGKNLRPVALGPFDYEARNDTPSLWIAEGLTHYYTELLLTRAGLATHGEYLRSLSSFIGGFQRQRGSGISLSEASMRTWEPGPHPVSYRSGGVAVGFLLDQQIRQATSGRASLDEVMREAYRHYSGDRGYTEEQFEAVASQVAGIDLSDFFRRSLRSSEALDFAAALRFYGLRFESAPLNSPNWRLEIDPEASPESRAHWQAYLTGPQSISVMPFCIGSCVSTREPAGWAFQVCSRKPHSEGSSSTYRRQSGAPVRSCGQLSKLEQQHPTGSSPSGK